MRVFAAVICALAFGVSALPARAEDRASFDGDFDVCSPVNAPIVTSFFLDGCTSPFGICTQGNIDSGPLAGKTRFAVESLLPGPLPELLLYGGMLVIETANGTVNIKDKGVLNQQDGSFFEFDFIASGTRAFADATGTLFSDGVSTPTGFDGTISGQICGGPPPDPILD